MSEAKRQEERVSPLRTREQVRLLTADELLSLVVLPVFNENQISLRKLKVEGLLSFGENTSFEFGSLNILVGANGSGKSNLIDCIRILRYAPLDIQEPFKESGFEEWIYRSIEPQSSSAYLQATIGIPELSSEIRHQIRLGPPLNSRALLEEAISSNTADNDLADLYFAGSYRSRATINVVGGRRRRERVLGTKEYDAFQSILSQIRDIVQYPEITRLSNLYASFRIYSEWAFGRGSRLRESSPTGGSDMALSELMNNLPSVLNSLENTSAHDKIRQLLQELKETYRDYTTPVSFGRVGIGLLESPFDLPISAKRLSDGTLRFLALAAILLHPNPPPLICLEEPELGMHPDMIRMVAKMIAQASTKTQVIITTHSEHLLSDLQDDFDVLFAFDIGLRGSIVRQFSQQEYKRWREDHTLGELWTSGELGGNRW